MTAGCVWKVLAKPGSGLHPHSWKLAGLRHSARWPRGTTRHLEACGDLQGRRPLTLGFPSLGVPNGFGLAGWRPGWGSLLCGALGAPGRNMQPVGNQLMLSPSWNSGTWRGPGHAGVGVKCTC